MATHRATTSLASILAGSALAGSAAIAAVLQLSPSARAGEVAGACDAGRGFAVIAPPGDAQAAPLFNETELTKSLAEGGGLATGGYKAFVVGHTLERADTLTFLRGLSPELATPETAAVLEDVLRSSPWRAGALGAAMIGGYLVIDSLWGSHAEPKQPAAPRPHDTLGILKSPQWLTPCPLPDTSSIWLSMHRLSAPPPQAPAAWPEPAFPGGLPAQTFGTFDFRTTLEKFRTTATPGGLPAQ